MHFVIIGQGSSASRFINILLTKKHQISVYQHKLGMSVPRGCGTLSSLNDLSLYQGMIISSPTSTHLKYLTLAVNQHLPVLVEKPFSDSMKGVEKLLSLARKKGVPIMIGLNLRFLPIVRKIKEYLDQGQLGQILHADLYVGQYLPTWRPWLDYRQNYSANYQRGGGVALDLIHEIDLFLYFFPGIKLTRVVSNKLSGLEIDVEDFACFQTTTPPYVQVKMDYLHHLKTRQYRIVGSRGSLNCDIFNRHFEYCSIDGQKKVITDLKYFDVSKTFETEIDEFIKVIKTKKQPELTERSLAIDALQIAMKARKHVSG